jgi:hypothetical protein
MGYVGYPKITPGVIAHVTTGVSELLELRMKIR